MYQQLCPYIHQFVMLRQGALSQMYVGRIIELDSTAITIQTYMTDGSPAAIWTINLDTVTEFLANTRQLDTLALKVLWASSPDADEPETPSNSNLSIHSNLLQGHEESPQVEENASEGEVS